MAPSDDALDDAQAFVDALQGQGEDVDLGLSYFGSERKWRVVIVRTPWDNAEAREFEVWRDAAAQAISDCLSLAQERG